ncbi:MAG: glycosyltransferase, partial [Actinomycetota bacterium]
PYDLEYSARVERASARKKVKLLGPLVRSQLWALMRDSSVLLSPIAWEEPFGLAMAEAQAAGCPVVAFKRGATEEVIVDGLTGILVEPGDIAGAVVAVSAAGALDRSACRLHAERALDISRCIEAHIAFYEKMMSRG